MGKLNKKTFNILKICFVLVAVFACGIYYVIFYEDFAPKISEDEISFEILIEEETKSYIEANIKKEENKLPDIKEIEYENQVSTISEIYEYEESIEDDDERDYTSGDTLKININEASADLLQEINTIGPSIAASIVSYREENGPFKCIEEITNVKGIGKAKFNIIKEYISVND